MERYALKICKKQHEINVTNLTVVAESLAIESIDQAPLSLQ